MRKILFSATLSLLLPLATVPAYAQAGADSFKPVELKCQPLKSIHSDPFGVWSDPEIADAKDEGWQDTAKVCVGQSKINGSSYFVTLLIGSGCSTSVCPVRVTKTGQNKKRQVLTTDMMCSSPDYYAFDASGTKLKACDQVYSLGGN